MANELSDQDVLIKILTAFEKGGIEEAQKAAKELKESMKDASGGSDMLSKAMEVLGGKGKAAGDTLRGLYGLMTKDGPGAVQSLGKSIQGLGNLFGAALGPAGAIASIAMAGYEVFKGIMDAHAKAAEEAAQKAAEEAEKAAQALDERIAGAADAAREHVKGLAEEFMATAKATEDAVNATQKLKDAQLELATARIDAQMFQREGESAEDFAARKKDLEQQKINLKASHDEDKIQSQIEQLQAQIDALDKTDKAAEEAAGKAHAAWLNNDDFQALVAAREEKEKAETFLAGAKSRLPSGEEWSDEVEEGDSWVYAASKNAEKLENKFGAAEAEAAANDEAAKKAYEKTLADNAQQKQILQAQIDAITISRQAGAVRASTSIAKIQQDYEASKPQPVETEEPPPAPPSVRDLWNDASGQIQRGQVYKGQHYDIDNGQIQQKARQALSNAGRIMAEGKSGDDAKIISDLVAALEEMGARIADRNAMLRDLQQAVAIMRTQAKNARS